LITSLITESRDRKSRLRAFRASLAEWRKKFEREVNGNRNAENYMEILPELCQEAAFVETDIPKSAAIQRARDQSRDLQSKRHSEANGR
jgi:hypothetical protein